MDTKNKVTNSVDKPTVCCEKKNQDLKREHVNLTGSVRVTNSFDGYCRPML